MKFVPYNNKVIEDTKKIIRIFCKMPPLSSLSRVEELRKLTLNNPACDFLEIYIKDQNLLSGLQPTILAVNPTLAQNLPILINDLRDYCLESKMKGLTHDYDYVSKSRIRNYVAKISFKSKFFKKKLFEKSPTAADSLLKLANTDFISDLKEKRSNLYGPVAQHLPDLETDTNKLSFVSGYDKANGTNTLEWSRKIVKPLSKEIIAGLKHQNTNLNNPPHPVSILSGIPIADIETVLIPVKESELNLKSIEELDKEYKEMLSDPKTYKQTHIF